MRLYGLIGKKLSHSFSKKYFTNKFREEQLDYCRYELFELQNINEVNKLLENEDLRGFNITIPYKQEILPYLDKLDDSAKSVGAVNVVKIIDSGLVGYNSDYYGFKDSLEKWLPDDSTFKALVLGTGGASKAVIAALEKLNISFRLVSRQPGNKSVISYEEISPSVLRDYRLIINTTPLGMSPNTDSCPELDYGQLGESHYLYDLVYNPEITLFLQKGMDRKAKTKNGLEMLHLQAEKSWEIWNS